jgi:hypothetical protein
MGLGKTLITLSNIVMGKNRPFMFSENPNTSANANRKLSKATLVIVPSARKCSIQKIVINPQCTEACAETRAVLIENWAAEIDR